MDVQTVISEAQSRAKRDAIRDRILTWLDQARDVDIVREQPVMVRKSCDNLAPLVPTGTVKIELRFSGLENLETRVISGGRSDNADDWEVA